MNSGVVIITLGCRSNFAESQNLAKNLSEIGLDVYLENNLIKDKDAIKFAVLNSCSITSTADKKSRQTISKLRKEFKNAQIVAFGCSTQKDSVSFEKKNVDAVFGAKGSQEVFSYIKKEIVKQTKTGMVHNKRTEKNFLKIQDGCNNFCSYCIVPYLRGRSESKSIETILQEATEKSQQAKEIVLTAINIADFKDESNQPALKQLIKLLGEKFKNTIFSFGSLYPECIDDELLNLMKNLKNFKPYFHLSLQSGSDKILKDMNRHYTTKEFYDKICLIRKYFKNATIECDLISGYPTETEDDFNDTIVFLNKCKFDHIHFFSYSIREGTYAATLKQLPDNIKKERMQKLLNLNI